MELSNSQVKKAGDRIRRFVEAPEDYEIVASHRDAHVEPMFDVLGVVTTELTQDDGPVVCAGRPKRTKSIIRKLRRGGAPSLARMGDLAGVRIICPKRSTQMTVKDWVADRWETVRCVDRTEDTGGYRGVHIYVRVSGRIVEVQLRTPEQHVWADESESFGERVKEGGGERMVRDYLRWLSGCLYAIESGTEQCCADMDHTEVFPLARRRRPVTRKLNAIRVLSSRMPSPHSDGSFRDLANSLVVFDNDEGRVANQFYFSRHDTERALAEFHRLSKIVDEKRREVVLLNSGQEDVLSITHARFFPDRIAAAAR